MLMTVAARLACTAFTEIVSQVLHDRHRFGVGELQIFEHEHGALAAQIG
jgi:hypothetical protein